MVKIRRWSRSTGVERQVYRSKCNIFLNRYSRRPESREAVHRMSEESGDGGVSWWERTFLVEGMAISTGGSVNVRNEK